MCQSMLLLYIAGRQEGVFLSVFLILFTPCAALICLGHLRVIAMLRVQLSLSSLGVRLLVMGEK